jgi:hypothetical protein
MYYLKCNNCGELSEVKTEYMVFCSFCGKKLENNFSSWLLKNPEKTFEEFKQLICVSDIDIMNNQASAKPAKKRGAKYWIAIIIGFAIFYVIGHFGSQLIIDYFRTEKTEKQVLEMEWIRETYGKDGLSVKTPVKLTKGELPIPDNLKPILEYIDSYNSMTSKGFKIIINSAKYVAEAGPTNLQGSINGSVMEMKMLPGVTEFSYSEEPNNFGDIQGIKLTGTYKESGIEIEFMIATFASGSILWQVIVGNQADDEIGRQAKKRVIESIEIIRPSSVI